MNATALFELRRENLSKMIDHWIASKRFETGKSMCEHFDLEPAYIAQLLNSKRQIGEKSARALEQKMGLDALSLDQTQLNIVEVKLDAISGFEMQVVDAELFQLKPIQFDLKTMPFLNLNPLHYLIFVASQVYQPVLRVGDVMVCDRDVSLKQHDRVCVYLSNGFQLIVEYLSQAEQCYSFQSLDGKRQVYLQQSDVEHIHRLVAIISL